MTDTIQLDTIICGDCLEVMRTMPAGFFYSVITSPPYWGLRDYGVDGQIGLEKTPEEYIAKMVAVFREVWRVLRDDGTLWLNLGDSYGGLAGNTRGDGAGGGKERGEAMFGKAIGGACKSGCRPKDLCGIPWRVALALQADGWYLRQDIIEEVEFYCPCGCGYILEERIWRHSQDREIIWKKPNPMPESVTDRCTKAHEYIFLMTKKPRYYYDAEAIKEPQSEDERQRRLREKAQGHKATYKIAADGKTGQQSQSNGGAVKNVTRRHELAELGTRNKRSVWTVPTAPYKEAHFATFPPKLIEPCILAGCPEWVCKKCGEPRRRIVEKGKLIQTGHTAKNPPKYKNTTGGGDKGATCFSSVPPGMAYENKTTGWTDCGCNAGFDGGIVLDPFMGSGTVAAVAYEHNRHYVGIDLNPDRKIQKRIQDAHDKYALFDTAKGGD